MHHFVAMHQSMGGVAQFVSFVQALLHKVKQAQASDDSSLEHELNAKIVFLMFLASLKATLSPEGPVQLRTKDRLESAAH